MNILVLATTVTILCVGYIESMLRIGQLTDEEVAAIEDLLNNGEDNIDDMINIDIMPPPITHIIHRSINSIIKLKIKYLSLLVRNIFICLFYLEKLRDYLILRQRPSGVKTINVGIEG